jgi:hypothetical protein
MDVPIVQYRRGSMVTGTRARSYDEMVDALAEEALPTLQEPHP